MNRKIIFILILLLNFVSALCFADIDIEIPIDIVLAKSEFPLDNHKSYSMFFPYFSAGPLRCSYIFESPEDSKWTFGVGGSLIILPFQTLSAFGSASYRLCSFENGGVLELTNMLDLGIFCKFYSYFDVTEGKRAIKPYISPAIGYTLNLYYRNLKKMGFYVGTGLFCGTASIYDSIMVLYGVDVAFGFRISTHKK